MKTSVKYVKKTFYVNAEKKTVTCKLDFTIDIPDGPLKFINDSDKAKNVLFKNGECYYDDNDVLHKKFSVVGVTKCTDNDTFDEELGKKLALTKAQAKAFVKSSEFYERFIAAIFDELSPLTDLEWGCVDSAMKCWAHYKELGGFELTDEGYVEA